MRALLAMLKGEPLKAPPALALGLMLRVAHDADAADEAAGVAPLVVAQRQIDVL